MSETIDELVVQALEDLKGKDIVQVNVRDLSDVMDTLIIASGTSSRHVKSLAGNAVEEAKKQGFMPLGVEGMDAGDWVLVDFGDTVLHVMQPETRAFYDLEKLWSMAPGGRASS